MGMSRKTRPLIQRLSDKFVVTDDGCWHWVAGVDGMGCPRIRGDGYHAASLYAARVAWEFHAGHVQEGMELMRTCDDSRCINPAHRELTKRGTQAQMELKGLAAENAVKERCKRGHLFDETNTYWYKGNRHCRACVRAWARLHYQKKDGI